MKILNQVYFQRNFQFVMFLGLAVLFLLLGFLNLKVILSNKKPTLIAIDENSTRIISDMNDPIYKTESLAFIKRFLTLTYNFDQKSFLKQFGGATGMMSEHLWNEKKEEILSLKSKIERDEISLKSEIEKITISENSYFALIRVMETSRLKTKEHEIAVRLELKRSERSESNPWGLEVKQYEESEHQAP